MGGSRVSTPRRLAERNQQLLATVADLQERLRKAEAETARVMGLLRSAHDEAEFCERTALGDVLYDIEKGRA